jgi:DNA repair exonuclease SbcCD nuclease subunit
MTRVIHTADTHIGYRQYHSPERRRDFLAAFERVIEDAVEEGVDAVVHAGDVFHDRRPDLPDLLRTVRALRDLAAADVPFLAVVGNHEDKREAQWLDLFEQLDLATRLDDEGVVVGDVTFYGLDFVPRSRRADLDYEFAPPETDHAALVAHGLFEPFAHADWDTDRLLAESTVDFDALLLGDNHHPDSTRIEDTWVTYAGSTERVSADEQADRGYNIASFDDGVDITRRGLPTRDFAFVDVELRDGEGVERVRERVREHDVADAVVYVRVEGEGEPITPAPVEEFATERGALVARVNDRRAVEETDAELDVTFADPDDAVRERIGELGLSAAARGIDETVRASGLADANVRGAVADRVEELLDEDPGAFDGVTDDADGDVGETAREQPVSNEPAAEQQIGDDEAAEQQADDEQATEQQADDEPATEQQADEPIENQQADDEPAGEQRADDGRSGSENGDQQASMEEYL